MDLEGRVAIVTGGNQGLGRVISLGMARAGARLVIAARSAERNEAVAAEIQEAGAQALSVTLDVTDPQSVQAMVRQVLSHWGQIDILVNNAAVFGRVAWVWDYDPQEWERIFAVNLRGPFLCCRAVVPPMIAKRRGKILNVAAGVLEERVDLGVAAYYASKAGLINFTRQLAAEVRPHGILVNAICPGALDTQMSEEVQEIEQDSLIWEGTQTVEQTLRFRTPEEILPLILFLVSDASDMLTGRFIQVSSKDSPQYLQL